MNVFKKMALAFAVMLCTQGIMLGQGPEEQNQATVDQEEAFVADDITEAEEAELAEMDAEDEANHAQEEHSQE